MFDMPPPQRVFQFETEKYAFIKSMGLFCVRQHVIAAGDQWPGIAFLTHPLDTMVTYRNIPNHVLLLFA